MKKTNKNTCKKENYLKTLFEYMSEKKIRLYNTLDKCPEEVVNFLAELCFDKYKLWFRDGVKLFNEAELGGIKLIDLPEHILRRFFKGGLELYSVLNYKEEGLKVLVLQDRYHREYSYCTCDDGLTWFDYDGKIQWSKQIFSTNFWSLNDNDAVFEFIPHEKEEDIEDFKNDLREKIGHDKYSTLHKFLFDYINEDEHFLMDCTVLFNIDIVIPNPYGNWKDGYLIYYKGNIYHWK